MKVEAKKEVEIILKLTEKEASWLKNYLQNSRTKLEEETEEDYNMRSDYFTELNRTLNSINS